MKSSATKIKLIRYRGDDAVGADASTQLYAIGLIPNRLTRATVPMLVRDDDFLIFCC
jgi:hypothetical protein